LFLAAGSVISCFHHQHDIFRMGGLRKVMPLAFWSFMIGSAALSALPFTSGFYSKHEILSAAFDASPGLWAAGCLGAMITGIYSFRLVFVVFFGKECPVIETRLGWRMRVPLILLGALALFGGLLKIPLDSVFPVLFNHEHGFDAVAVSTAAAPVIGLSIAAWFYLTGRFSAQSPADSGLARRMRIFCFNGWGIDALYGAWVVRPFKTIAELNKNDVLEHAYIALASLCRAGQRMVGAAQTGNIRWYASSMALGVVVIIAIGWLS